MATINLNEYELKQIREAIQRGDKYVIIPDYELFIAFHPLRITSSTDKELHFGTSAYDRRVIKNWLKESKCEKCDGQGWYEDHAPAYLHDEDGGCIPGNCPVQVQCELCGGTGIKLIK